MYLRILKKRDHISTAPPLLSTKGMVKLERIERRKNRNHARTFLSSTQIKGPDLSSANAALDEIAKGQVSEIMISRIHCSAGYLQLGVESVPIESLKHGAHATPPTSLRARTMVFLTS